MSRFVEGYCERILLASGEMEKVLGANVDEDGVPESFITEYGEVWLDDDVAFEWEDSETIERGDFIEALGEDMGDWAFRRYVAQVELGEM